MKYFIVILFDFFFIKAGAQQANSVIPTHHVAPVKYIETIREPAYIDSSRFARYLDWQLQQDSLPESIKPVEKGLTVEIWYAVSKEGYISFAKSPANKNDKLAKFIIKKFVDCPYQWLPAYQNGRPVKSFHKIKIVF